MPTDDSKRALREQLRALLTQHAQELSPHELIETLSEASQEWLASEGASEVSPAGAPPSVSISHAGGDEYEVRWTFSRGDDLRALLPDIIETQAVMLELEPRPPMMASLDIALCSAHHPDIPLQGRVVHQVGARSAVQIFAPPPEVVGALQTLPDVLDEHAAPAPAPQASRSTPAVPNLASILFENLQPEPVVHTTAPAAARPHQETIDEIWPFQDRPGTGSFVHVVKEGSARWQVADVGLEGALIEVALERPTGVLELMHGDEVAMLVVFDRGAIVDLRRVPEREEDTVEFLLNKARKITKDQVHEARERASLYGCSCADALIDLGFLDYSDVRVALKTRLIYLLRQLWDAGYDALSLQRFNRLPRRYLSPPVPLVEQLFARIFSRHVSSHADKLELERQRFAGLYIARRDPPVVTAEQLGLDAKQSRFFSQGLVSHRPVGELLLISGMTHSETIAMLSTLDRLQMLDIKEINLATEARQRHEEQISLFLNKIGTGTHFDVLGVHWSTYDEELEEAYAELMERYSDDAFPAARRDILDKLKRARAGIRASYDAIRRRSDRRRYRLAVTDSYKVESSLEMYLRQGDAAKIRRDVDAAIDFYRRVLEINPAHKKASRDLEVLVEYKNAKEAQKG
jgi:hypothetical protein